MISFLKFNDNSTGIATTLKGFRTSVYSELSKAWDKVEAEIIATAENATSEYQIIDTDIKSCLLNLT